MSPSEKMFLVNLLGFLGVACNCTWPLFRSRFVMLVGQAGGSVFFLAHYYGLEAWTAATMTGLGGLQALLAIPLGSRPGFGRVYLGAIPIIFGAAVVTWQGLPSVFSTLAFALLTYGRYQLDPLKFRLFLMISLFCWIAHNLLVGSLPGLCSDFAILSTSSWMYFKESKRAVPPPPQEAV